jgi:hypothetical protein
VDHPTPNEITTNARQSTKGIGENSRNGSIKKYRINEG